MEGESSIKAFLNAFLGKQNVTPEYSVLPVGPKHRQRFLCELRVSSYGYIACGNSTTKNLAQTNAAKDFVYYLFRQGVMSHAEVPSEAGLDSGISAPTGLGLVQPRVFQMSGGHGYGDGGGLRTPEPKVTKPVSAPPAVVEAAKPEPSEPVAETEKPAESEAKPQKAIKELTDAERAAIRAAKFGGSTTAATEDKKLARAQRFGLPVTAASNGKASKIGEAPANYLETLKKRAERFGQSTSTIVKKVELEEKIKKRQERFGDVKNGNSDAKKIKIEVNKSLVE